MPVHDVDVEEIGPGVFHRAHVIRKPAEIAGKQRRRNEWSPLRNGKHYFFTIRLKMRVEGWIRIA